MTRTRRIGLCGMAFSFLVLAAFLPTCWAGSTDRFVVGQIILSGNTDSRDAAILSLVPFRTGDTITADLVQTAEINLRRFGIFTNPSVEVLDPHGGATAKDVLVRIEETAASCLLDAFFAAVRGDLESLNDAGLRCKDRFGR